MKIVETKIIKAVELEVLNEYIMGGIAKGFQPFGNIMFSPAYGGSVFYIMLIVKYEDK